MSQITFLLGAGISIPAQLPSTDDITSIVLSGEGFRRHTDGAYECPKTGAYDCGKTDAYVSAVTQLLSVLNDKSRDYVAANGQAEPNYEDVYHILDQIDDEESRERQGPVVHAFLNPLAPDIDKILRAFRKDRGRDLNRWGLFQEAKSYVKCVVWRLLQREPSRLDHLRCLVDACRDDELSHVTIATLNHDTILERCLKKYSLEFTDGLGESKNGARNWDYRTFERIADGITLLKLHGSINWYRFQDEAGIPRVASFDGYRWHAPGLMPQDPHPLILVGTFNKEREYIEAELLGLHYQFLRSLRATNRLVVAGYGWADKGINARVFEWMNSNPKNAIVLIEPSFNDMISSRARYGAKWRFDKWQAKSRLAVIERGIECTEWSEIASQFR